MDSPLVDWYEKWKWGFWKLDAGKKPNVSSSTNPENFAKIGPVDFGLREIAREL